MLHPRFLTGFLVFRKKPRLQGAVTRAQPCMLMFTVNRHHYFSLRFTSVRLCCAHGIFYIIPRKFCFAATHLSADGKQKPYLCTHMFQFSPGVPSRRSVRVPRVPLPSTVASSHPPSLTPHSGYSQRAACWS